MANFLYFCRLIILVIFLMGKDTAKSRLAGGRTLTVAALSVLAAVCLLTGCDRLSESMPWLHAKPSTEGVVATVGTHVLYEDDVRAVTRGAVTVDDSTAMAERYIRSWVTEWLLFDNAKRQLGTRHDIESMVDDYRRSLYVHEYEQLLVAKRMPTEVEPDSMLAYYEQYGDRLILEEDILKGIMLILPKDAHQIWQLKKWLSKGEEEIANIENYAYQQAIGYQFFVEEWQPLQNIMQSIPADEKKLLYQLKHQNQIEVKSNDKIYLLQATEKHFAGDKMPFEYAQPRITKAILEKRRMEFVKQYENNIFESHRLSAVSRQQ